MDCLWIRPGWPELVRRVMMFWRAAAFLAPLAGVPEWRYLTQGSVQPYQQSISNLTDARKRRSISIASYGSGFPE